MATNNRPSVLLKEQLKLLQGMDGYMLSGGLAAVTKLIAAAPAVLVVADKTSRDSPSLSDALHKFAGAIDEICIALTELQPEFRDRVNKLPALIAAAEQNEKFSQQPARSAPPAVRKRA